MGTRADFYIGRGEKAEWLGSIGMDGYPDGQPSNPEWKGGLVNATSEADFREKVLATIEGCGHGTKPEQGWPWPWEDSRTTDYAYAFDEGKVWSSCFGRSWVDPLKRLDDDEDERIESLGKVAVFPNMKDRQNVTLGERSGLLVVTVNPSER